MESLMSIPEMVVTEASVRLNPPVQKDGFKERPAKRRTSRFKFVALGVVLVVVVGIGAASFPAVKDAINNAKGNSASAHSELALEDPAELIAEDRSPEELQRAFPTLSSADIAVLRKSHGLRLTKEAFDGLRITTAKVETPTEPRPLPPQFGTINYDNDRLFILKSRFAGEVAVLKEKVEPAIPTASRTLRYGDRFEQGDLLAVVWSKDLGTQKAALVDAVCALRLSTNQLERYGKLYEDGALPLAVYKLQERQVQGDRNAVLTAERTLKMWRLTNDEIKEVKNEAKKIIDQKRVRDADYEKKWAEVNITVPRFNPDKELRLTLVEKNTNLHDMVDPSTIMFKLADLSRLKVWVQPAEEYLPLIRERLQKGAEMRWQIQFQADPPGTKPLELPILQVVPSIDSVSHTPMVFGYLPNKDNKYLIGQFVTATIFVPPDPDTVAVPTNALNDVEGQMLVLVEKDAAKREYMLRRVAVEQRFQDVSFVRSKLTEQEKKQSEVEVLKGRRPIQALLPGERVLTSGIVELTRSLDTQLAEERFEKQDKR